jgi:hypothetical protein
MKSRTTSMYKLGLFIIPLAALVVYMVTSAGPAYATSPGTKKFVVAVFAFRGGGVLAR